MSSTADHNNPRLCNTAHNYACIRAFQCDRQYDPVLSTSWSCDTSISESLTVSQKQIKQKTPTSHLRNVSVFYKYSLFLLNSSVPKIVQLIRSRFWLFTSVFTPLTHFDAIHRAGYFFRELSIRVRLSPLKSMLVAVNLSYRMDWFVPLWTRVDFYKSICQFWLFSVGIIM